MNSAESPRRYQLRLVRSAARSVAEDLPEAVATACVEFIQGDLLRVPYRVGKPLCFQLEGKLSARRGTYRIVYTVDEASRDVTVLQVEHRPDAYR